ncbi:MAG: hypothetical protein HONBIEJF_01475 [Fimbriimonadaceae bacterium]|nr:hypothetical protein [Fimbriimonadaceae bacterium]
MLTMRAIRWSLFVASCLVAGSALAQYPGAAPVPENMRKGWDSIALDDLKSYLGFLAGPETKGRGTGQPGYQKAAEYVADKFKSFGLKPIGDDGTYFQNIVFDRYRTNPMKSSLQVGTDIRIIGFNTMRLDTVTADTKLEGPIVFVRAKGAKAQLADPDKLKDAIVVLSADAMSTELRRQIFFAGAKAVLTVQPKVAEGTWSVRRRGRTGQGPGRASSSIRGVLSQDTANRLASAVGSDAAAVNLASMAADTADISATSKVATIEAVVEKEEVKVPNVVGLLEGSDPELKSEIVALGGHLDHLGESNGQVFPGADDDGSGITALLAIAKAFHANPIKPKRSILFMGFCGEEMGLIGSGHYTQNPILPLDKTICLLQMDMVGRNEEHQGEKAADNVDTIHLVGSKRISMELHEAILEANKHVNFKFEDDEEDVYTRSDHYMFAQKGVPIAFIFSGFHPDYHQPTDTIEKINFDKIRSAARLFFVTAFQAANRAEAFKKEIKG